MMQIEQETENVKTTIVKRVKQESEMESFVQNDAQSAWGMGSRRMLSIACFVFWWETCTGKNLTTKIQKKKNELDLDFRLAVGADWWAL